MQEAAILLCKKCFSLLAIAIFHSISSPCQPAGDAYDFSCLLDSAELLKLKSDYELATGICKLVIQSASKEQAYELEARAHNEMADIYRFQGVHEIAAQHLDSAQSLIAMHLDQYGPEYARNLFHRGKILRSKYLAGEIDDPDSVRDYYAKSLALVRELDPPNADLLSNVLFEAGYFYSVTGNHDRTLELYNELILLLHSGFNSTDYRRGYFLMYMGDFFYSIGDYERAEIFQRNAMYIFNGEGSRDLWKYIQSGNRLATTYFEMLEYRRAVSWYEKMIDSIKVNFGEQHPSLIRSYTNIEQSLMRTGQVEQAISYGHRALELLQKYPDLTHSYRTIHNNLAEAYGMQKKYGLAEQHFGLSMKHRIENFGENDHRVYEGYRFIGEFFEGRGMYIEALEYYSKSLQALFPQFQPGDLYDNPDFESYENPEPLLYILFYRSGTLYKLYKETADIKILKYAFEQYQLTYSVLEKLFNSSLQDKSTMHLFNRFGEGLDQSIACAVKLYKLTKDQNYISEAFRFVESNKYILLYKGLLNATSGANSNASNPSSNWRLIASEIDNIRSNLKDDNEDEATFEARNELMCLFVQGDHLLKEGAGNKASDQVSIESDRNRISLEEAQEILRSGDEYIVEYHWTDQTLYAFIIGKSGTDVFEIEDVRTLLAHIHTYSKVLEANKGGLDHLEQFITSSHFLYEHIFKPIEDKLQLGDGVRRFIIIPDGPLSTLPFDAFLMQRQKKPTGYWSLDYLCKKYTLSYAYSLGILRANLEKKQGPVTSGTLTMAFSELGGKSDSGGNLHELPYSAEEVRKIDRFTDATTYLGEQATEDMFKREARKYSVIHLALHGIADTLDMFNSRIVFRQDPEGAEDGNLYAHELYGLNLSSIEMVVLSACETGIGKLHEGEGIFSIARGFAFAGCSSIIMSLWQVNDKATARLMENYYEYLSEGLEKDVALQKAKIKFISYSDDHSAHPGNWASFIALGNYEPVQLAAESSYWTGALAGSVLLLLFVLIMKGSLLRKAKNILDFGNKT